MKHMEPYIVEKRWTISDYTCIVVIHPMGHRCGYVGLPENHFLCKSEPGEFGYLWELESIMDLLEVENDTNGLHPYCTWLYNTTDKGLHWGNYFETENEALEKFCRYNYGG